MQGNVLLLLGLAGLFAGAATLVLVGVSVHEERRQIGRSLAAIAIAVGGSSAPVQPFSQRVIVPALSQFAAMGRRLSPSSAVGRLNRQLDLAGNPTFWPVERVLAAKAAGLLGFGALALLFFGSAGAVAVLVVPGLAALGFFLPDLLVYNRGVDRQADIQRGLPDALDLLTISVEAGLGFDAALAQVARNTEGPLAGEFFRVLQEMQIGRSRTDAFRSLTERSNVAELGVFVGALVQADNLGIPLARVLREQSKEMRVKRRQRGEEKAMKVPIKMMFPMMIFILPVLFVIVLGPGAITIMNSFG